MINTLYCQSIEGIWRGTFQLENNSKNIFNYELIIKRNSSGKYIGLANTFLKKEYSASSNTSIIEKGSSVIVKEQNILNVKKRENTDVCLMTCILKLENRKGIQVLKGTFTSKKKDANCFSGQMTLIKVEKSFFFTEKKSVENDTPKTIIATPSKEQKNNSYNIVYPKKIILSDTVIEKRENKLIYKIETNTEKTEICIFDNGIIDGDSISVYINNMPVITNSTLSQKPICFPVSFQEGTETNRVLIKAENLGKIPPNTGLVVFELGKKRYELPVSADLKQNALIVFIFNPQVSVKIERF